MELTGLPIYFPEKREMIFDPGFSLFCAGRIRVQKGKWLFGHFFESLVVFQSAELPTNCCRDIADKRKTLFF